MLSGLTKSTDHPSKDEQQLIVTARITMTVV